MFKKLGDGLDSFVKLLLVINVFSMLFFSVSAIVMRWFGVSFLWVEPLVRHLVFITAFLGAVLATSSGRHISIEILEKYLEASNNIKFSYYLKKLSALITVFALAWLTYSGYTFFLVEKEYGRMTSLGLHSSALVFIIPAGFILLLLRSLFSFLDFSNTPKAVK